VLFDRPSSGVLGHTLSELSDGGRAFAVSVETMPSIGQKKG
jgi:hypothetical protein